MNEIKEALQRLFDHNYGNDFYIKAEEDAELIEKELDNGEYVKFENKNLREKIDQLCDILRKHNLKSLEELDKVLEALDLVKKVCEEFELPMGEQTSEVVYKAIGKGIMAILDEEQLTLVKEVFKC